MSEPESAEPPAASSDDTGAMRPVKRRRRWRRWVLGGLAVVLIVLAGGAGASYWWVRHEFNKVKHFSTHETRALKPPPAPGKPQNILLIGSDSRQCLSPSQFKHYGNPSVVSGQRSDVIIVVRLVPATDTAAMLSIPRDTVVPIAGTDGSASINTAYNYGPNQLIKTIEQDFGIPINHVVAANFCGFTNLVNALGGIYLDFPYPATDWYTGLRIRTAGCQLVDGTEALALVRSRHYFYYPSGSIGQYEGGGYFEGGQYDGMSDWSRIRRQQAFFHAVLDRVHADEFNLLRMAATLDAVVKNLTVDPGFTTNDMLSLAYHYRHFTSAQLVTYVLPTYEGYIDGVLGIAPAVPQAAQVVKQFLAYGTPTAPTTTTTAPGASTSSTTSPTTTTTTAPGVTTTTSAPDSVVLDTPQTLPEPWNPYPCSP